MKVKIYLLSVLYLFSSNVSAGLFDENMYSFLNINLENWKKGDVIFSGGPPRLTVMVCDMDKQVSMSAKGFLITHELQPL